MGDKMVECLKGWAHLESWIYILIRAFWRWKSFEREIITLNFLR